jgi:L-lactate dehydrogenase complex protein LldG
VHSRSRLDPEKLTMKALFHTFSSRNRYERAQKLARAASRPLARRGGEGRDGDGGRTIRWAPGPLAGWTMSRDLPAPAAETFRDWWRRTRGPAPPGGRSAGEAPPAARSAGEAPPGARNAPRATLAPFCTHSVQNVDRVGEMAAGEARADILRRIRAALGDAAAGEVPRAYRTSDERPRDEIVTLFAERVAEYRATVHRVGEAEVGATLLRIAEEEGARRIGIPADLAAEWRPAGRGGAAAEERPAEPGGAAPAEGPAGLELVEDDALSVDELDGLDGALTGCAVAIAETGTFVLDGGVGQGRRALSLVPDLHVCVVREDQVVGLVPEAVEKLEDAVRAGHPLTFVSGPSATSDIELDRVEGVHGPRVLHVVVVA